MYCFMKLSQTKLTLILLAIKLIQGCDISYCSNCSIDGQYCNKCANGYQLDDTKLSCIMENNDAEKDYATNTGLIIGLCISILLGICLSCFGYKKCVTKKNKEKKNSEEKQQKQDIEKAVVSNQKKAQIERIEKNLVTLLSEDYRKNKYLNSKCLDSRIEFDKILFKLSRKQNIFPEWSLREFTKFTPVIPSKKMNKKAQFSGYLCLIPQNVLEITKQELQKIQGSPSYEPIKKNSIDDLVTLQKQLSQSDEKNIEESQPSYQQKRRTSSLTTTDCQSNRDSQGSEDDISQDCNKQSSERQAKINVIKQSQVTINIEDIELANSAYQNEQKIPLNNEEFVAIQIEKKNNVQKQSHSFNSIQSSGVNQKQILSTEDGITITNSKESNNE